MHRLEEIEIEVAANEILVCFEQRRPEGRADDIDYPIQPPTGIQDAVHGGVDLGPVCCIEGERPTADLDGDFCRLRLVDIQADDIGPRLSERERRLASDALPGTDDSAQPPIEPLSRRIIHVDLVARHLGALHSS